MKSPYNTSNLLVKTYESCHGPCLISRNSRGINDSKITCDVVKEVGVLSIPILNFLFIN